MKQVWLQSSQLPHNFPILENRLALFYNLPIFNDHA